MAYLVLAWVLSWIAAAFGGYHYRKLVEVVNKVLLEVSKTQQKEEEQETSTLIDPDDIEQQVRLEHKARLKALNPDD